MAEFRIDSRMKVKTLKANFKKSIWCNTPCIYYEYLQGCGRRRSYTW